MTNSNTILIILTSILTPINKKHNKWKGKLVLLKGIEEDTALLNLVKQERLKEIRTKLKRRKSQTKMRIEITIKNHKIKIKSTKNPQNLILKM